MRFFPGVTAERKMKQQRLGGVEKEKHKVEIRARVGKVPSRRGLLVIGNYHASLRASLAAPSQFAERWPRGVVVDVDADRVRKPPKARAKAGAKRGAGLLQSLSRDAARLCGAVQSDTAQHGVGSLR